MDTQGGEKVRGNVPGEDLLGLALACERWDPVGGGCDVLEGLSMIAPLLVVGKRRIDTRRAGRRVRFKQRDKPVGGYFAVITRGVGGMPDYGSQIPPAQRWEIISYIRALQKSQNARLDDLSPEDRKRLESEDKP